MRSAYRSGGRNSSRRFGTRSQGRYKKYRYAKNNQKGIKTRYMQYRKTRMS